jgi:hypothetical protein
MSEQLAERRCLKCRAILMPSWRPAYCYPCGLGVPVLKYHRPT